MACIMMCADEVKAERAEGAISNFISVVTVSKKHLDGSPLVNFTAFFLLTLSERD